MEEQGQVVQTAEAPAAKTQAVTAPDKLSVSLSLDAAVFLKELVGRVTLSAKDPNIIKAATVVNEIRQAVDAAMTVIHKE